MMQAQVIPIIRFLPLTHGVANTFLPYKEFKKWVADPKEFNSKNYRSHEFTKNHLGKMHVLFSGCSVTFGDGLFLEEVWSYKLWKSLGTTSGYFSLAMQGNNIPNIVFEIMKYCSIYGKPDMIVLNLPDIYRSFKPHSHDNKMFMFYCLADPVPKESKEASLMLEVQAFQAYKMLELFCDSNDIPLYSFSWSADTENLLGDGEFKTFFKLDKDEMSTMVYDYANKMKENSEFALDARDEGKHFGIAIHNFWYKKMYSYCSRRN